MNPENTRKKKLEKLFAQNPKIDTLHMTADDQAFTSENAANAHTSRLADKKVKTYKSKDFKPSATDAAAKAKAEKDAKAKAEKDAKAKADAKKAAQQKVDAAAKAKAEKDAKAKADAKKAAQQKVDAAAKDKAEKDAKAIENAPVKDAKVVKK